MSVISRPVRLFHDLSQSRKWHPVVRFWSPKVVARRLGENGKWEYREATPEEVDLYVREDAW